jgi:hypothetical protein
VVLCCDEKSQIQALQRSQSGLPLGKGHIRTQTHNYYRNGTVTLFAARGPEGRGIQGDDASISVSETGSDISWFDRPGTVQTLY